MNADNRLYLPQVTLCAVTSVNVAATLRALAVSLGQVRFGACKLLTDAVVTVDNPQIEIVPIARLGTSGAYSQFILEQLPRHIATSHCLVAQWDGHVLDAQRWQSAFLDYDYIGASWPQFDDGHDVGNGGFSLRSKRLMELCCDPAFVPSHPEDVAIGRVNRAWLEGRGMRFTPKHLADQFAAERTGDLRTCFGFHGVWNMPRAIGTEAFWEVYENLDDRATLRRDFETIVKDLVGGANGMRRAVQMLAERYLFKGG